MRITACATVLTLALLGACGPNDGNTGGGADGAIGGGDSGTTCFDGSCTNTCGAAGTDLVYVVDETFRMLSFDPRKIGTAADPFTLIGNLNCPAGSSWPGWGGMGPATPFSMSVDRNGTAWVLYTSGEIFSVSTANAGCSATSFVPGQSGFELFGMGFVSDTPGSDAETLFIAGGAAEAAVTGRLGSINKTTLQVTDIGSLPSSEFGPELTGTGDAQLFGYYPGSLSTFISKIVRTSGQNDTSAMYPMTPLASDIRAWAFAHWGGQFYVFVTTGSPISNSRVLLVQPNGAESVAIADIPYMIVGAGVSTCAPIEIL